MEVHARSLARELSKLGVEVTLSSDPRDLPKSLDDSRWDVVHTHGSGVPIKLNPKKGRAVRVHTLHGTTFGRMAACREWYWLGGYQAAARELAALFGSDVVLSVHSGLSLYALAERLKKTRAVCSNGWDSQEEKMDVVHVLPEALGERLLKVMPFWLYVGRGADPVKNIHGLARAIKLVPDLQWVAIPGDGFEHEPRVLRAGVLSTGQISKVFEISKGLVLPSFYEGQSLTVLEALAHGVPVVATRVGGIAAMPAAIEGLVTTDSFAPQSIADALRAAEKFLNDPESRVRRAEINQKLLPKWASVAEVALSTVRKFREER